MFWVRSINSNYFEIKVCLYLKSSLSGAWMAKSYQYNNALKIFYWNCLRISTCFHFQKMKFRFACSSVMWCHVLVIHELTCFVWQHLEAYLEPSWTSTMELFCVNNQRLKAVSNFRKKSCIVDVRLSPKYASGICVSSVF